MGKASKLPPLYFANLFCSTFNIDMECAYITAHRMFWQHLPKGKVDSPSGGFLNKHNYYMGLPSLHGTIATKEKHILCVLVTQKAHGEPIKSSQNI